MTLKKNNEDIASIVEKERYEKYPGLPQNLVKKIIMIEIDNLDDPSSTTTYKEIKNIIDDYIDKEYNK